MGAWGTDVFTNDMALDFVIDIVENPGLTAINTMLDEFDDLEDDYVDADLASMALVAGEIVAASNGRGAEMPPELAEWMKGRPQVPPDVQARVRRAVKRSLEDSELRDLWEETEKFGEWQGVVRDLLDRMGD